MPVLDQDIDLGHAWYRFLVVTMSLAVLVSRVLLLLLLVRGNYGVQVIAGILCNRKHLLSIKNHVVNATTWQSILAAAKAVVAKNGLPITSMAHAEGLNAGFSGAHPLQALSASAQARKYFEAAADALSEIVRKLLVKGHVLASGDVLKVWKAVKGKVVMAKRNKKLMKAVCARVCAHMYMYMYVYMHTYTIMYVREYLCTCICAYAVMSTYKNICVCIHIHIYICVYTHVYLYLYISIYIDMYIYIYIYVKYIYDINVYILY